MLEMKAIRDKYDPHGGRAIGSREMLDIDEAEYGGEMLYINKSKKHPMWAMEYCRDEGLRKYWDDWSYPYHKEGDGPLYRGNPAPDYNHNMDQFAVEMVRRWYDYWLERPGTGTRVSSGGVKIVFSDTNTHHRGELHYRTSGVVDAMRIPKDAFYAHQVMWNGWVEPEEAKTYIVGHWNYSLTPAPSPKDEGSGLKKPVYVVSTGDEVELFLNGRSIGKGRQSYRYLFAYLTLHSSLPKDSSLFTPHSSLLTPSLVRGETPSTPSYTDRLLSVGIAGVKAGSNAADARYSYDDNELTVWASDGERDHAWVKYTLQRKATVSEIALKLRGFRQKCYPLEVYAGKKKVWEGITPATLGYVHLQIAQPVAANDITIKMVGPAQDSKKFGELKELAGGIANEMDRVKSVKGKTELQLLEVDLLEQVVWK